MIRFSIALVFGLAMLASRQASAQRAGLLLGVSDLPTTARTIWIAVRGDTVTMRSGRDLYVPLRDGFWRVAFTYAYVWGTPNEACRFDFTKGPKRAHYVAVGLEAAPLGATPRQIFPTTHAACSANYEVDSDESVTETMSMMFVGNDHVSVVHRYVKSGDSANSRLFSNRSWLLSVDTLARYGFAPWSDDELASVPPMDADNRERTFAACHVEAARGIAADTSEAGLNEAYFDVGLTDVWMISRGQGAWRYEREAVSDCNACNNDATECPMHELPPAAIVGRDTLAVSLSAIQARVRGATDAFSSPAGDVIIVRSDSSLHVFRGTPGTLGASVATLPLAADARIVMAQWATGRSVDRWSAILSPRLEPAPIERLR